MKTTTISVYGYRKSFTILLLIIIPLSIIAIIGFANAVYNNNNTSTITNPNLQYQGSNNNQCDHAHASYVKMFYSQIVPKYIIGKDYKVIPVNPATTNVLVNRCSLATDGISR